MSDDADLVARLRGYNQPDRTLCTCNAPMFTPILAHKPHCSVRISQDIIEAANEIERLRGELTAAQKDRKRWAVLAASIAERDGKFLDSEWCCKLCDGEIPDGHTDNCDLWKAEKKHLDFIANEYSIALTERDAARAEADALRKDAERYAVVRACVRVHDDGSWVIHEDDPHIVERIKKQFDAAIDAALERIKKQFEAAIDAALEGE